MKQQLEIMKVLVASTAHLTAQEAECISSGQAIGDTMPSPMGWEYGGIVYVGGLHAPKDEGMSDGLADVITVARANGVEWVRFDSDGPVLDNCATYEW